MSLETIIARLKTINAAVTGITAAYSYDDLPGSIEAADLPAAMALPNEGDIGYGGGGEAVNTHRIRLLVYVVPTSLGNIAQNLAASIPYVNRFRDAYADAIKLDALSGVNWAYIRDYRVGILPDIAGTEYIGVEFTLEVQEQEGVSVGL